MSKPARAKLTIRQAKPVETVAPAETAPVAVPQAEADFDAPECYARDRTEIVFNATAAVICHDGQSGDTEEGIAQSVDAIFYAGAFAELRPTGVFLTSGGMTLDDPANYYSLSVDATVLASIDEQSKALDAAAMQEAFAPAVTVPPVVEDGFIEDTVFSGAAAAEAEFDAGKQEIAVDAPKGDQVELDLTTAEVTFATTKLGAPYAKLKYDGSRTLMAFGPVAEALRGRSSATCILSPGRTTDKIVGVYGSDDGLIFEPRKAA